MQLIKITTFSPEETQLIGRILATHLKPGDCIPLTGDMGAGKTCFVQGVALGLDVPTHLTVSSPSFTLVNHYPGRIPLFHVDLYRLESSGELDDIELSEIIDGNGATFIEWPQLVLPELKTVDLSIHFLWDMTMETKREITLSTDNIRFHALFEELRNAYPGN